MFLKSNVHLKELTEFLQKNFNKYIFKPDTSLNLIEIITKENAKKGIEDVVNVLAIGVDCEVTLVYFEHSNDILNIEKQAQKFVSTTNEKDYERKSSMDKGKIMNELQQEMGKAYCGVEILERNGALALKVDGEAVAWFDNWNPDEYIISCGPKLIEKVLRTDILLEFYKEGRKALKNTFKKYTIKVFTGSYPTHFVDRYLVFNRETRIPLISSDDSDSKWQAHFTKEEIEALKNQDNIAIDWDKVELEEAE